MLEPDIQIKFCGLKSKQDTLVCQDADYLGYIVEVPCAKRSLSFEKAAKLVSYGKKFGLTVAVTTSLEKIPKICESVKPDIVQIHTKIMTDLNSLEEKMAAYWQKYALVIGVESDNIINYYTLAHSLGSGAEYIVIEASMNGQIVGGQGKTRNWIQTAEIIKKHPKITFFVAGGLNSSNIRNIISSTKPAGIDVSSGIENSDGSKSPVLTQKIIRQVRNNCSIRGISNAE
ncbi:MAG: phosphoribosylanthranilate isomerase [Candidatus Hodarchaeota archaeon]